MKKLLLSLLFIPAICLADGPRYSHSDTKLNEEVKNLYHDLKYPNIVYGKASTMTVTTVKFLDGTSQSSAASSTGRVLQIVFSSTTDTTSTTSGTFQPVTNIKAQITLSNAANKVKVWGCGSGQNNAAGVNQLLLTVKRDATTDFGNANGLCVSLNTATGQTTKQDTLCFAFVDTPGGVGPYIYQAYIKTSDSTNTVSWPNPGAAWMIVEETN